jgi:hypothetical protein
MENAEARPSAHGQQQPTQGFPTYHQVPPPVVNDPRFLAPPMPPRRRRAPVVFAIAVGVAVALALGLVVGLNFNQDDRPFTLSRQADEAQEEQAPGIAKTRG